MTSDGKEFTITRQEIIDEYKRHAGGAATKRAALRTFLSSRILEVFKDGQIDFSKVTFDFNPLDDKESLIFSTE